MRIDHGKRCGAEIFWGTHVRTGKASPLCRPGEGMPANAKLVPNDTGETIYELVAPGEGEFVNHFSNCKYAKEFRG